MQKKKVTSKFKIKILDVHEVLCFILNPFEKHSVLRSGHQICDYCCCHIDKKKDTKDVFVP